MGRKRKTFTVCTACGEWCYNWRLKRQRGCCKCGQRLEPFAAFATRVLPPSAEMGKGWDIVKYHHAFEHMVAGLSQRPSDKDLLWHLMRPIEDIHVNDH